MHEFQLKDFSRMGDVGSFYYPSVFFMIALGIHLGIILTAPAVLIQRSL
jgi:hypothetical protein